VANKNSKFGGGKPKLFTNLSLIYLKPAIGGLFHFLYWEVNHSQAIYSGKVPGIEGGIYTLAMKTRDKALL
jgi:hypothetical protein